MSLSFSTTTRHVVPKFRYLSAWFCPFAHRATLALEHHSERVEYEWVEALGWYQQEDQNNVTGTGKEWYYHWKAEELKRVNPSALVPTLIPLDDTTQEQPNETEVVFESLVTMEYIDQVAAAAAPLANDDPQRLIPQNNPYWTAQCRIWSDRVNRDCCSPYYGVLVRQDPVERQEHFDKLLQGLSQFSQQLQKTSGPLFLDQAQLSTVDLALLPWAWRYYVLEHYCGPDFVIPTTHPDGTSLEPYHEWLQYVTQLPRVQRTLPEKDRYLEHIGKYADGSARSKVANAVRRGVAAHELDDEKDEY
eukprot:CAMPEP_0172439596 /NCGR_PEP_ID=MMETSP1065-20121228/527_1 /TAXON_ID=265537 /ORGANISM="Amphiprora paludosa, Strain CCMP125" /LENGTH=303 /DNA_ID=CAMNT_0013188299 /DNA_START=42 /DNA_END=953 /DNA_ORIENTATION=-